MTTHYRISLPCEGGRPAPVFALTTDGHTVINAAHVARWAIGKRLGFVLGYYRERGATIEALEG